MAAPPTAKPYRTPNELKRAYDAGMAAHVEQQARCPWLEGDACYAMWHRGRQAMALRFQTDRAGQGLKRAPKEGRDAATA